MDFLEKILEFVKNFLQNIFWNKEEKILEKEKLPTIEQFKQDLQKYHYLIKKKDYVTTPREWKFFRRLQDYLKDKEVLIFNKIRVWDIIEVESTKNKFRPYSITSRIDRSHIDFIVVNKKTLKIICAIELDDYTHNTEKAKEKDEVKNILFDFAKIPLFRFTKDEPTNEEFDKIFN